VVKDVTRRRILAIELRRSAPLWAGGMLLLIALLLLLLVAGPWAQGTTSWTAQWTATAWWERFVVLLLWPVSVAAGAVQGIRDHRSGTSELLGTTPRAPWHRAAGSAGALALALTVAYVLVFLVGGTQVIGNDGYVHFDWLPILAVGMLAFVAGGCLGMGIARTFPSVLTPAVLAVGSLIVMMALSEVVMGPGGLPNRIMLLSPGLSDVPSPFLTVAGRVNAGQALWLTGLAATGFLLLVAGRRRARLLALLPTALCAAVAVPLLPSDAALNYVVDKPLTALVCESHICVTRVHEPRLAALAGPGDKALGLLSRLPSAPSSVRERVTPWPEPSPARPSAGRTGDVVPVDFDAPSLRDLKGAELTRGLVAGAGTAPCIQPVEDGSTEEDRKAYDEGKATRELAARTVAAAWFTGELKPLHGDDELRGKTDALARPAWDALRALPAAEQRERVSALRTAALSCEGDLLTVLQSGASR
jgi:hypothetical protein